MTDNSSTGGGLLVSEPPEQALEKTATATTLNATEIRRVMGPKPRKKLVNIRGTLALAGGHRDPE
ncbi:MAG: hypothetical protein P8Y01_14565 [Woeseiaceae bacterium]